MVNFSEVNYLFLGKNKMGTKNYMYRVFLSVLCHAGPEEKHLKTVTQAD